MDLEKEVFEIALTDVVPNRFQPREKFEEEDLSELAQSIKEHGVIQPIIVRKIGDKYEIVAGERRFRASQLAGKTTIPALIRNIDDRESAKIALLENLQRKNLTAIEEARTYQTILKLDNLTQEELANNLGISQPAVANKLRLLNLIPEVQEALLSEKISERHARSLLNIADPAKQKEMLNKIILQRLTVKQLDDIIAQETGVPVETQNDENKIVESTTLKSVDSSTTSNLDITKFINENEQVNNNISKEDFIDPRTIGPTITENQSEEPPVKKESIAIKETQKPINRHIFDGLRRDEVDQNVQQINNDFQTPQDRYKDILENTFIPTPTEVIKAKEVSEHPLPKYQGPKYDYPNIPMEDPNDEHKYSTYNILEPILEEKKSTEEELKPNISSVVPIIKEEKKEVSPTTAFNANPSTNFTNDIYDMRFAINNFRQAIQNTEKFGFKIDVEEFDFDNVYQIVIKIDKK